ncbi:hypothetical protein Hte_001763 [Hypoxylon texense]
MATTPPTTPPVIAPTGVLLPESESESDGEVDEDGEDEEVAADVDVDDALDVVEERTTTLRSIIAFLYLGQPQQEAMRRLPALSNIAHDAFAHRGVSTIAAVQFVPGWQHATLY